MKNFRILAIALVSLVSLNSCDKDENDKPVNEDEVITTVTTTLTGGGKVITLISKDLDGDGPNAPLFSNSGGSLKAGTTYEGTVTFLNETKSPAENITQEVKEEGNEHQLFFQAPVAIGTFSYADADANGKPIGLKFTLVTAGATTGNLLVTLRHEPVKSAVGVAAGDITNAGGSTDASVLYPIVVE